MLMMTESPTVLYQTDRAEWRPEASETRSDQLEREPAKLLLGASMLPQVQLLQQAPLVRALQDIGNAGLLLAVLAGVEATRRWGWYKALIAELIRRPVQGAARWAGDGVSGEMVEPSGNLVAPHVEAVQWIQEVTGLSHERVGELIGVTRQTLHRWERGEVIADGNRRRVFAVRDVLERALELNPSRERLVEWLDSPRGAEALTPFELLAAGKIDRARLLALSVPSPRLVRAPAWVHRPVPRAFRAGAEHRQQVLPPEDAGEPDALPEDVEPGASDE